ncbi:probable N-acetyltransferase camello [Pelobates cultripes]|uniref:Probable N-acetyltransferase camello n=1 Tax=Pelobates cultripes TaxID=61616 RepID=A0AAD1SFD7_PELCU|nr:probable N-acetyltransferase camello [Pelobates cultripes]
MSSFSIRLYKDLDYEVVRGLFARGILEHSHMAFRHAISVTRNWLFMLVMFLVPLCVTGSVILSILAVVIALIIIWICSRYVYSYYVAHCLSDDMLNIQKYYLQRDGYRFWVAESGGEVVGAVAAVPSSFSSEEKHTELKRLTVARSHRGKGIAKALCRTVIEFARNRGSDAVVLETSLPQTDAWKLYEKMGFHRTLTIRQLYVTFRVIDFVLFRYQYDLLANKLF